MIDQFEGVYDRQKERHGKWATFAWMGSGVYLFAVNPQAHFLSWQAALFFIVGMFAAAVVFGLAAYVIQRGVAKLLVTLVRQPSAGTAATVSAMVSTIGLMLFAIDAVVIFLIARWAVGHLV